MIRDSIQMARRKQKRSRRAKFTGVNLLSAGESYLQLNIWTEKLFRTNPFEFVTGITDGTYNPGGDGWQTISIPEIIGFGSRSFNQSGGNFGAAADNLSQAVARNITGKAKGQAGAVDVAQGLIMPAVQSALLGAGFKFGKKLTSKPRAAVNRQLKNFGLAQMVRV
jgi:hypothetical protein